MKNPVLQVEPVEIFGRGCTMSDLTQGNAIAFLFIQPGGLEVAMKPFVKINLMLAAAGEDRRKTVT